MAHVLMKRHPAANSDQKEEQNKKATARRYPRLVLVSSRTEKGVVEIVDKVSGVPSKKINFKENTSCL